MHIERYKSNGCYYLRLVRSKRITNANGESIGRKELVLSLGNYAQYDDGKPNYLDRLRQSFREGTPLIPALLPYVEQAPKQKYTITFSAGDKECFGNPKRLAPCILDPAFAALGLDELFASDEIAYELTRRGGWITSMPHHQLRKNAIYAFMPGSVFNRPQGDTCGAIVDLAPAIVKNSKDSHPVWRDGRAILLPIKR